MNGLGECVYKDGVASAFEVINYINEHPDKSDIDVSMEINCELSLVEKARQTIAKLKSNIN